MIRKIKFKLQWDIAVHLLGRLSTPSIGKDVEQLNLPGSENGNAIATLESLGSS